MGGLFKTPPPDAPRTLRVLARLLGYPDAELRANLAAMSRVLHEEAALPQARLAELDALLAQIGRLDPLDAEADYVQLFDSGRRTSLHLFEHVHGDSRERGPAMIDLAQTYEKGGLYLAEGEMPDYLPVVLEFASTQPTREAAGFLGEIAHLINAIFNALEKRETRYASVMGALLDLAGESARPVQLPDEASIDEAWEEPAAFDGCHSSGQERPGEAKPVHIVRRPAGSDPQRSGASA
ncbi:MAG: nitrate reductase molybdenum cofactor assembly chaperone [Leptothrix sp. (in: Bacteria)]|jgi:nitrate reductase delta subunit|nr:nitrate reductase molybdenum cofactor assembly chaperone [Leptothrix sp. (in: b-proteobacteria)]